MKESFEEMLKGGHPNSLGRTLEVVEIIENDPSKLEELYGCYFSQDELVRLRVSNGIKRISREHREWLIPYIDRLLNEISKIDQASTKWTLAELFGTLKEFMSPEQYSKSKSILKHNLENDKDWIVINWTMQTLAEWAVTEPDLREWLKPRLVNFSKDNHKSISGRAKRLLNELNYSNLH